MATNGFAYEPVIERLDGTPVGDLRFQLPRIPGDLVMWGRALHNCLDTFADAVTRGDSTLVGVTRDGRIIGCVEIDPSRRRVRQLLGTANRPLPPHVTRQIVEHLCAAGAITTT